ncbi:MAG: hypothetical protein KGI50_05425 [Patescibacteria group bacterium]|nr:hypothetical protein [Patescibacteria group bacterium]MDE2438754.1 hypothetical protein [Patescibacteria group bacterium]
MNISDEEIKSLIETSSDTILDVVAEGMLKIEEIDDKIAFCIALLSHTFARFIKEGFPEEQQAFVYNSIMNIVKDNL